MLNLEHWLRQFSQTGRNATKFYGSIVTQVRHPAFYTRLGVQDTITGRYELLALHVIIVLAALRKYETVNGPLSRGLVETFVADMDDIMRQLGIGDMSVPRRVKKASAGLLERSNDYMPSLANGDTALLAADLSRHFELQPAEEAAQTLSLYSMVAYEQLRNSASLKTGSDALAFPDPDHYFPAA